MTMTVRMMDSSQSTSALMAMAAQELKKIAQDCDEMTAAPVTIPPACLTLIKSIPGNMYCIDCGSDRCEMASVNHGTLHCGSCIAKHRALGRRSTIKSTKLDGWSVNELLFMLEGGNQQLADYFAKHKLLSNDGRPHYGFRSDSAASMCSSVATYTTTETSRTRTPVAEEVKKYKTKAAKHYRNQLGAHVKRIVDSHMYNGRDISPNFNMFVTVSDIFQSIKERSKLQRDKTFRKSRSR
uniref:Arf-GAP domain-containing protein n=1 Tax=Leptocylindrus danicus TaxID=163516 RepID=A0A7S2PQ48_9STRA|mmetsp:Transcript_7227/g.10789  ORF Transcript_7227/g.10789 Transcript_7227/m.10789 type:complete len:239 (+) Transcript_7227:163-879(+)